MNVCRCGAKFSFDNATLEPSPSDWQSVALWRCGRCGNISHAAPEAAAVIRSPAAKAAPLSVDHLANGQAIHRWATPDGKVKTVEFKPWPRKVPMTTGEPLIFKTWELLMSKVKIIMAGEPDTVNPGQVELREQWKAAKNEARGIAEVLAILMHPFMESADHVVRCAVAYHKDPEYVVPGLAPHLWDPTKNYDGSERTPVGRKQPPRQGLVKKQAPAVPRSGTKPLAAADIEGIKLAYAGGIPKEALCDLYGCSMEALNEALK